MSPLYPTCQLPPPYHPDRRIVPYVYSSLSNFTFHSFSFLSDSLLSHFHLLSVTISTHLPIIPHFTCIHLSHARLCTTPTSLLQLSPHTTIGLKKTCNPKSCLFIPSVDATQPTDFLQHYHFLKIPVSGFLYLQINILGDIFLVPGDS